MGDNDVKAHAPRPVTMDDVQRIVGAMTLELEFLRRENADLRDRLNKALDERKVELVKK